MREETKSFRDNLKIKAGATFAAAATATTLIFGGPVGCAKQPVVRTPIEELAKRVDLEKLGFESQEEYEEYLYIKERLNDPDITDDELVKLQSRLENLMLSVIKEKVIIWEYEKNQEKVNDEFMPGSVTVNRREHNDVEVYFIPESHNDPAHAIVVLKNPESKRYIIAEYYKDKDEVFKCDETIYDFIHTIARLQWTNNPSLKGLKTALETLERFMVYDINTEHHIFDTDKLAAEKSNELEQMIDEILYETERM